jgi:hypothetical protein
VKPDNGHRDLERLRSTDSPELFRALNAARQQLPHSEQLVALAASLSQRGIPVARSTRGAARAPSSATRLKLLLGAGVVGPLTLALLLWRSAAPHATAPIASVSSPTQVVQATGSTVEAARRSAVVSTEVSKTPASPVVSDAAPPSAPAPSSSANEAVATSSASPPSASSATAQSAPRAAAAASSVESVRSSLTPDHASPESVGPGVVARPTEIALLRDARLALSGNPSEALALAEQHRTLFPHGAMVQERELIAISALARLNRHTAVLVRAAQFERDFPNSPYRKQVSALAQ